MEADDVFLHGRNIVMCSHAPSKTTFYKFPLESDFIRAYRGPQFLSMVHVIWGSMTLNICFINLIFYIKRVLLKWPQKYGQSIHKNRHIERRHGTGIPACVGLSVGSCIPGICSGRNWPSCMSQIHFPVLVGVITITKCVCSKIKLSKLSHFVNFRSNCKRQPTSRWPKTSSSAPPTRTSWWCTTWAPFLPPLAEGSVFLWIAVHGTAKDVTPTFVS